jgi:hypothetical protein
MRISLYRTLHLTLLGIEILDQETNHILPKQNLQPFKLLQEALKLTYIKTNFFLVYFKIVISSI